MADVSRDSSAPGARLRLRRRQFGAHSSRKPRTPPARSASPDPIPARLPLAPHPHGQKSSATPEPTPASSSRGIPRAALPALSGPPTYVTAEGNGSSDEGPISKDWKSVRVKASRQPAAIFAIEDQSPSLPSRGKERCWEPRAAEKEHALRDRRRLEGWRTRARGVEWRGGPLGRSRVSGKGRWREDPLARLGCSAPRLPRLSLRRRHQGRLWKQSSASLPALARSRSPSRFPP